MFTRADKNGGGFLGRVRQDRAGAVAIVTALMLPIFVAASGLVVDAGYYRWRERILQSASDAAAIAAGQDAASGLTTAAQMNFAANEEAVRNGFMDGNWAWNLTGNSTANGSLAVNSPPVVSATYKNQTGYIEVVLIENRARLFSQVWMGTAKQTLQAHSVVSASSGSGSGAATSNNTGSGCIMALDPSISSAFQMQNQGSAVNANCEIVVNSTSSGAVYLNGQAQTHLVVNSLLSYVGGINYNNGASYVNFGPPPAGITANPNKIATAEVDPYKSVMTTNVMPASSAGTCIDIGGQPLNWNSGTLSLPAGHYCKGFAINGGTVNLSPGITYVDQQFQIQNGATVNGLNGSTLVLGNGYNLNMSGGHLNIKAPTTGITAGLAFTEYTDSPSGGSTPYFNNNSTMVFTGAIYFPRRQFYLQQGGTISSFGGTSGCGHIIANQIDIENGVSVGDNCAGIGVLPFGSQTATWSSAACATPTGAKDTNCTASGSGTGTGTGTGTGSGTGTSSVKIVE